MRSCNCRARVDLPAPLQPIISTRFMPDFAELSMLISSDRKTGSVGFGEFSQYVLDFHSLWNLVKMSVAMARTVGRIQGFGVQHFFGGALLNHTAIEAEHTITIGPHHLQIMGDLQDRPALILF